MIFHEIKELNLSIGQAVLRLPAKSRKVIDYVDKDGYYYCSGGFFGYDKYGFPSLYRPQSRAIHKAMCDHIDRIIPV
jgi:hypothetical protein